MSNREDWIIGTKSVTGTTYVEDGVGRWTRDAALACGYRDQEEAEEVAGLRFHEHYPFVVKREDILYSLETARAVTSVLAGLSLTLRDGRVVEASGDEVHVFRPDNCDKTLRFKLVKVEDG